MNCNNSLHTIDGNYSTAPVALLASWLKTYGDTVNDAADFSGTDYSK